MRLRDTQSSANLPRLLTVASLRDQLRPDGWEKSDEGNYELTIHSKCELAIAAATGDEGTGLPHSTPSNKFPKGSNTIEAINLNNQIDLFQDLIPLPSIERATFTTWILLRALTKMTAGQRDIALGAGSIALLLNEWIEKQFVLPEPDLPNLGREPSEVTQAQGPEAAAEALRRHWGLGELPIKNMITLLESKGVRIFSLAIDAKEVDAFSMWYGGRPFVFLNTLKSAEHCRFDAAHELGHLVMHRHGEPHGQDVEREANAFASAFLMPRRSILANAPRLPTLPSLIAAKRYWTVSVAALNYRLHALGLTTDWIYRTLCIQIAEAGYRTSEPESVPYETSQLLAKVFAALREEGIAKDDVARELSISPTEIEQLTFGLMLNAISNTGQTFSPRRSKSAHLQIVK